MEKERGSIYLDWEWSYLKQLGPKNTCAVELCKICLPEDYRGQNWQDVHRDF